MFLINFPDTGKVFAGRLRQFHSEIEKNSSFERYFTRLELSVQLFSLAQLRHESLSLYPDPVQLPSYRGSLRQFE